MLSTAAIVPACRSLDCVSILTRTAADAETVWRIAAAFDDGDPYSRPFDAARGAVPWLGRRLSFGIPRDEDLEFFGDTEAAGLYWKAVAGLESHGGVRTRFDFGPFREAGAMLYEGPWVAERLAALGDFLSSGPTDLDPVVGGIMRGGSRYSAADAFRSAHRLNELRRQVSQVWSAIDVLLLPTAATVYTRDAVRRDPVRLNATLGYYTSFVNLLDLAAVAMPAGFRSNGIPFGVSLVGPAFSDPALIALAGMCLHEAPLPVGGQGCIPLAVVGAHLSGQPLNHQLTERGARLMYSARTSDQYRLFVLSGTEPAKPGLVRHEHVVGRGIDVEVWAVPEYAFGSFVAAVPPPLTIGNVRLDSGEWVKGFLCEPVALRNAVEITHLGGWRQFRALS